MRSFRAVVKESNNLFDNKAGDHDKLYLWVVCALEDDDFIVKRSLVADLGEALEVTAQGRKFVS